jgi:hypothetical protein
LPCLPGTGQHRDASRIDLLALVLAALIPTILIAGCQARRGIPLTPNDCELKPGMDTGDLALCGCVSADTRADYAVPLGSEQARNNSRTVTILNYMCPLGAAGIAQVVVVNGTATQVNY